MSNNKVNVDLKNFYTNILKKNPLFYDHQFIITFDGADLPSAFKSDPSNPQSITYYVKSSSVPKIEINEATVNFLSQDFVVPSGVKHGGTWDITLMMSNSLKMYMALRDWQKEFASLEENGGGNKKIPSVTAHVHLLDSSMTQELHDFVLEGVFPTKVPDLPMAYENNSTIPEVAVTFTYQYMYRTDEGDPLAANN